MYPDLAACTQADPFPVASAEPLQQNLGQQGDWYPAMILTAAGRDSDGEPRPEPGKEPRPRPRPGENRLRRLLSLRAGESAARSTKMASTNCFSTGLLMIYAPAHQ